MRLRQDSKHRERAVAAMQRTIAVLRKNSVENLHIDISEYHGRDLLALRVWTLDSPIAESVPTKKGVTLSIRMLPEIIEALQQAELVAQGAGLLDEGASISNIRELRAAQRAKELGEEL